MCLLGQTCNIAVLALWPSSYNSLQQNETFLNIMVTWQFPAPQFFFFFEGKTHPIQSCVEFEGPSSKLGWQQVHSHHLTPSPFLILHFKNRSTLQSASEGGPKAKRECMRGWGVPVTLYTGLTPHPHPTLPPTIAVHNYPHRRLTNTRGKYVPLPSHEVLQREEVSERACQDRHLL